MESRHMLSLPTTTGIKPESQRCRLFRGRVIPQHEPGVVFIIDRKAWNDGDT